MKNLYTGNCKTVMKEEDRNKWRDSESSWVRRHDIKMYINSKQSTDTLQSLLNFH
jgi:hypothetical protein